MNAPVKTPLQIAHNKGYSSGYQDGYEDGLKKAARDYNAAALFTDCIQCGRVPSDHRCDGT